MFPARVLPPRTTENKRVRFSTMRRRGLMSRDTYRIGVARSADSKMAPKPPGSRSSHARMHDASGHATRAANGRNERMCVHATMHATLARRRSNILAGRYNLVARLLAAASARVTSASRFIPSANHRTFAPSGRLPKSRRIVMQTTKKKKNITRARDGNVISGKLHPVSIYR